MIVIALAVLSFAGQSVELSRQWKPNSTIEYEVASSLQVESRDFQTSTFIPEDLDTKYNFTFTVGKVTPEGFAGVTYKRPSVTITEGETVDSPPVVKTEDVNEHLELTLSPVNAITDLKDLTPPRPKSRKGDGLSLHVRAPIAQVRIAAMDFLQDYYRLALFIGTPETSMDFGPSLPLFEVEPGDTWDVTATYQPQKLKGKKGKMAPQRLDYKYKYVGLVESGGKQVHRIEGSLALDTDVAPYLNDLMGMTPRESHLTGFKLKLSTKVEYDLDKDTCHTLAARAVASGDMSISITDVADVPYVEERIKGRTRMKLVSIK